MAPCSILRLRFSANSIFFRIPSYLTLSAPPIRIACILLASSTSLSLRFDFSVDKASQSCASGRDLLSSAKRTGTASNCFCTSLRLYLMWWIRSAIVFFLSSSTTKSNRSSPCVISCVVYLSASDSNSSRCFCQGRLQKFVAEDIRRKTESGQMSSTTFLKSPAVVTSPST